MNRPNPYDAPRADLETAASTSPASSRGSFLPAYKSALLTGLKIQLLLGLLTSLVLDGGEMFRWFCAALACQCVILLMLLARRPRTPTRLDLAIVRYGIVILLAIFLAVRLHFQPLTG